ncbi:catenin (Cadherin-associated protein), alpha 3 [Elysia marginata]|uniref:Catenin (Cadherin-associated protein), alpha 3 n=1 Tax=Elysia marginata TaxID=1093978 RepID=A0AAV4J625_9GAST|nr:catenin (Cadherin-associated protein), alpha 3 [Elysia marginata]
MRKADIDQLGVNINGRNLTNLRYADDTALMSDNITSMRRILHRVDESVHATMPITLIAFKYSPDDNHCIQVGYVASRFFLDEAQVLMSLEEKVALIGLERSLKEHEMVPTVKLNSLEVWRNECE